MKTEEALVVSDAGPIIHLDELKALVILQDFSPLLIPDIVWREILQHRPNLAISQIPNGCVVRVSGAPSARLLALADSLALDAGERAALLLMETRGATLFLCDDAAARLAAETMGHAVHGTVGILVRSIRVKRRTRQQVLQLLAEIPQKSSLHLSTKLLTEVIASVQQSFITEE